MNSKTKIVVLHRKELIYTGIFVLLGILFIILVIAMFFSKDEGAQNMESTPSTESTEAQETSYIPGVYTTSMVFSEHTVDVEVTVDQDSINSIRLVNLDESVTTMYPLIEPVFETLTQQIYETQSLETVTYENENKYTAMVLLDAIANSLSKANATNTTITINDEEGTLP